MGKKIISRGFVTGLFLQLAIGPVFIFILNLSLQYGIKNGLFAVLGVTVVDYLYIILAIFGVGSILERKKIKDIFSTFSSIVLIFFGLLLLKKGINLISLEKVEIIQISLLYSFASTFILTISSPLTIIFWTSIFTSKSIELSLNKRELLVFGLSAGSATAIFLGSSVIILSSLNLKVPIIVIQT